MRKGLCANDALALRTVNIEFIRRAGAYEHGLIPATKALHSYSSSKTRRASRS